MIAWATEIKVRAERKTGELLAEVERSAGGRPGKNSCHADTSYQQALKENGLAGKTASRWQQLAAIPEEQFERSLAATKEVMGDITSASLLSQAKKKKRVASRMADDNTPVVIPPDKPKKQSTKAYEVWTAIETLAKTDIDPARLRSLMNEWQWFHIDEDLEPAQRFLTALKAHWRRSVAAPPTKPAQGKARG